MDPYQILGVATDASAAEIHAAYRRIARIVHPDAGGGDAAQMAHANEAWQILSDPARRAAYDAQRDPIDAWARAERDDVGNVGVPPPTGLRLIVVMTLVLLLVAFVSIVFIGFGRVGVAPQP